MRRRLFVLSLVIGMTAMIISACSREPVSKLPEGPQEITGILRTLPLSLTRRGTHVLIVNGEERYTAESGLVPLLEYEGEEVMLRGTLSLNTDPEGLPVLTVTDIVSQTRSVRDVFARALKLRLEIPASWRPKEGTGTGGTLHITASGSTTPVLTIARSPLLTLPAGSPVLVDSQRGVRVLPGGSSDQVVYIERGGEILTVTFTPGGALDPLLAPTIFLKILKSIRFTGLPQQRSRETATGSTIRGEPCGGPAGILCPEGSYCAITVPAENIGVCAQKMR